jgi:hypothetical protein
MKLKPIYRVTTFVPPEHLEALLKGILSVVPLQFGLYDQVAWWSSPGIEQFKPRSGSKPTVGKADILEKTNSVALIFALPRDQALLEKVLQEGLIPNHPWEEPVVYIDEALTTRTQVDEDDLQAALI